MWQIVDIQKPKEKQIITTTIDDKDILFTQVDNTLFSCRDLCPHEEIKISLGCIQDGRLKCSLHGFSFDLTTGKCDASDVDDLQIYQVKEENNNILIKL